MQLTPQESSAAFWNGAKQGALRSLGYVAATGAVIGLLLATSIIPVGTFGLGAALLTGISTVFTVGMFSGHQALSNYHQQKHNMMYESKLARLEGRPIAQERDTPEAHQTHSPTLTTILENGAKSEHGSFAEAEEERASNPATPTLH